MNNTNERQKNQGLDPFKKFQDNKKKSVRVAAMYQKLGMLYIQKAVRVLNCGNEIYFAEVNGKMTAVSANFCENRLCPMCAWRRSSKITHNLFKILSQPEHQKRFIFITLTIKNCNSDELVPTLDTLFEGWRGLTSNKRKPFRLRFTGLFRALEITYNKKNDTYHPHLHILAEVPDDYFSKTNKNYLTTESLSKLWQKQLKVDYLPVVDIRVVDNAKGSACEVGKYTVKSSDIENEEVLKTLDTALKNRRLISYHDSFKETKKRLKLIDDEEVKNNIDVLDTELKITVAKWNFGAKLYTYSIR